MLKEMYFVTSHMWVFVISEAEIMIGFKDKSCSPYNSTCCCNAILINFAMIYQKRRHHQPMERKRSVRLERMFSVRSCVWLKNNGFRALFMGPASTFFS